MKFEWDDVKARTNHAKHGIRFEAAAQVWEDPHHLIYFDRVENGEERWHAVGSAGGLSVLLVVHTYPDGDEGERVRIISARRATSRERLLY